MSPQIRELNDDDSLLETSTPAGDDAKYHEKDFSNQNGNIEQESDTCHQSGNTIIIGTKLKDDNIIETKQPQIPNQVCKFVDLSIFKCLLYKLS